MTRWRDLSADELAGMAKRAQARKVHPLGVDKGPLPSLRGPRSPKGKRGGMTAEQDKARRQERQRDKRRTGKGLFASEALVLRACMDVLEAHPAVALWWRQQTGAVKFGPRFVKFSFRGASDLMAVLQCSGKFCAIECKATGGKPSPEQAAFLDNVNDAGGAAGCFDNPLKLKDWLDGLESLNRQANSPRNAQIPAQALAGSSQTG